MREQGDPWLFELLMTAVSILLSGEIEPRDAECSFGSYSEIREPTTCMFVSISIRSEFLRSLTAVAFFNPIPERSFCYYVLTPLGEERAFKAAFFLLFGLRGLLPPFFLLLVFCAYFWSIKY